MDDHCDLCNRFNESRDQRNRNIWLAILRSHWNVSSQNEFEGERPVIMGREKFTIKWVSSSLLVDGRVKSTRLLDLPLIYLWKYKTHAPTNIHTNTQTQTNIYIYIYIFTHIQNCDIIDPLHTYIFTCSKKPSHHIHTHAHINIYIHSHREVCTSYTNTYAWISIHTIHTHKEKRIHHTYTRTHA